MRGEQPAAGHRAVPHTADLRIEAWAPTREDCVAEAVTAMVGSFVDMSQAQPVSVVDFRVPADTDEDLLAAVLDKAIYLMRRSGPRRWVRYRRRSPCTTCGSAPARPAGRAA